MDIRKQLLEIIEQADNKFWKVTTGKPNIIDSDISQEAYDQIRAEMLDAIILLFTQNVVINVDATKATEQIGNTITELDKIAIQLQNAKDQRVYALEKAFDVVNVFAIPSVDPEMYEEFERLRKCLLERYKVQDIIDADSDSNSPNPAYPLTKQKS